VNPRRLYRSADDRWIAGVAAGVAEYFDVDPILVRVIWIISIPLTGFFSLLAYIIMIVVVPLGPGEWSQPSPWQPGGAPVGFGAATPPAGFAADPGATTSGAAPDAGTAAPGAPQGAAGPAPTTGWDWRWQSRQDRWQRRAERWEPRAEHHGSGGIVFGALLIVVGGLIAWHQIDPRLDLNLAWPIAIVAFGVFLVVTSLGRKGQ
jgi:phage shock protein PspC (stress-responsive transcriptional regulator)